MKKFLLGLCAVFIGTAFAETKNITWKVGDTTYATSTCEIGNDLIIPQTNPTKYGYRFAGWWVPYIYLEYIESTGTQWIDTEITPNDISALEFNLVGQQGKTDSAMFGISINLYAFNSTLSKMHCDFGGAGNGNAPITKDLTDAFHTINMTKSNGLLIDGVQYADFSNASTGDARYSITLFGRRDNDDGLVKKLGNHKIKSCYIKQNGTLIRNFIPAKRNSDNEIGMFDTVSGVFFTNQGTGTFIAGPAKQ